MESVKELQDKVAEELRQELRQVSEKHGEILARIARYTRLGILLPHHFPFADAAAAFPAEDLGPPSKKLKVADFTASTLTLQNGEKSHHLSPRVLDASTSNGRSHRRSPRVPAVVSNSGDDHSPAAQVDEDLDENVLFTIRTDDDADVSSRDSVQAIEGNVTVTPTFDPQRTNPTVAIMTADQRLEYASKIINGWSSRSYPRACPLCFNKFSAKTVLVRHLYGSYMQNRASACQGILNAPRGPSAIASSNDHVDALNGATGAATAAVTDAEAPETEYLEYSVSQNEPVEVDAF